jgi:uncharacterized membrane protein (UPF0127 family)
MTSHKKTTILIAAIALIILIIIVSIALQQKKETPELKTFQTNKDIQKLQAKNITLQRSDENITINAEIADNNEERTKGLMYRTEMGEYEGMIFIFENERQLTFWMKNTLIPLDMIFADDTGKIINIEEAQPCKQENCPLYGSQGNAQYVLELNQGFCKQHNIQKGDRILI